MEKCLIVAIADNYAIGRKNALLWNLPGDMKYFRQQTTGNAVIISGSRPPETPSSWAG